MTDREKDLLEKKLVQIRPEIKWGNILKDCLICATVLGAFFVIKDFSKDKYYESSQLKAHTLLAKL